MSDSATALHAGILSEIQEKRIETSLAVRAKIYKDNFSLPRMIK